MPGTMILAVYKIVPSHGHSSCQIPTMHSKSVQTTHPRFPSSVPPCNVVKAFREKDDTEIYIFFLKFYFQAKHIASYLVTRLMLSKITLWAIVAPKQDKEPQQQNHQHQDVQRSSTSINVRVF